jgi:hypothetical protein
MKGDRYVIVSGPQAHLFPSPASFSHPSLFILSDDCSNEHPWTQDVKREVESVNIHLQRTNPAAVANDKGTQKLERVRQGAYLPMKMTLFKPEGDSSPSRMGSRKTLPRNLLTLLSSQTHRRSRLTSQRLHPFKAIQICGSRRLAHLRSRLTVRSRVLPTKFCRKPRIHLKVQLTQQANPLPPLLHEPWLFPALRKISSFISNITKRTSITTTTS